MRAFLHLIPCLIVLASHSSIAAPPPIGRRQFLRSVSLCLAATLLPVGRAAETASRTREHWSMHPGADIETLGLESFGNAVKELLRKKSRVTDLSLAERVRWKLQAEIWRRLEPKDGFRYPSQTSLLVAIRVDRDRYLYLNPHFRVEPPNAAEAAERTVGRIEYVSDTRDFRVLTYWFGEAPAETDAVILEL